MNELKYINCSKPKMSYVLLAVIGGPPLGGCGASITVSTGGATGISVAGTNGFVGGGAVSSVIRPLADPGLGVERAELGLTVPEGRILMDEGVVERRPICAATCFLGVFGDSALCLGAVMAAFP